ncbi:IS4 family transposase [Legionella antarctica]
MNSSLSDSSVWSEALFSGIELGDKRLTKRQVELMIKAVKVSLQPPERRNGEKPLKPVSVNVVYATETHPQKEAILEWILITTEDISSFEQARKVIRYYELRWRIEDFHKAWKSGTNVELLRMQSADNLEKMIVILSFLAIRLLQLKEYFEPDSQLLDAEHVCVPCDELLSEVEWRVLWKTVEKTEFPSQTPDAYWAFKAIAKLGGWTNSKSTGKAAWSTIWNGWFKLNERIEGFLIAQSIYMDKM